MKWWKHGVNKFIPNKRANYFIHANTSDYLKLLEMTYANIKDK